jgi:GT2 family glycosyltransferase
VAEVVALILNFRHPESTLAVVADLARGGCSDVGVVVLDNSGGSPELRTALEGRPGHELIAFQRNLGYCAAMNRGIARARELGASFVLFLNDDVRLPPEFLRPLRDALANDSSLAAVGPTIVTPNGRAWSQGGEVRLRPNLVTLRNQGGEPAPLDSGPEAVGFLPGACALYRLADLAALGDLDEDYFMYWEDVDLGARLRARERGVVWLPWIRVTHAASSSSGGGRSPLRKYMSAVNTVRWLRAHGRARDWFAFVLFEIVLFPLTFVSGTSPRAAWAKLVGTLAGLRGARVTASDVERWLQTRG